MIKKPRRAINDLLGQRFGRWTVLGLSSKISLSRQAKWDCRCDCGNVGIVRRYQLLSGHSQSCGCARVGKLTNFKHGYGRHPICAAWRKMIQRCEDHNCKSFKDYGARGIKVCDRWRDFNAFRDDMLPSWSEELSLDRIDNDGSYEPTNCRWATSAQQNRNTRRSVILDTPWGRMNLCDAALRIGIARQVLSQRMKNGWPPERLFSPPGHA